MPVQCRIIPIIFSIILLWLVLPCPVSGEVNFPDTPGPVWSDPVGIHRTLVSVSGDGNYIIAGSDTGILRFYARNGTILWTCKDKEKSVRSVAISRSGHRTGAVFVNENGDSSSALGEVFLYNRAGEVLWVFSDDPTSEWITMSDNGDSVYVSGTPDLYSFNGNGTLIGKSAMPARIWALDSARDGSFVIAGSKISGHRLDMMKKDGGPAWNFSAKPGFGSTAISPDGGTIAAAGYSHLYAIDRNGTVLWQFTGSSEFTSVAISRNGKYTVAGSQYYVQAFNQTGALIWQNIFKGMVNDVTLSDDGEYIIAGTSEGVYVFDREGKILWKYPTPASVLQVSVDNDGSYFAAGTTGSVYFFATRGNPAITDEPSPTTRNTSAPGASMALQPGPNVSPVPSWLAILAIFCTGIVVVLHRRN